MERRTNNPQSRVAPSYRAVVLCVQSSIVPEFRAHELRSETKLGMEQLPNT